MGEGGDDFRELFLCISDQSCFFSFSVFSLNRKFFIISFEPRIYRITQMIKSMSATRGTKFNHIQRSTASTS